MKHVCGMWVPVLAALVVVARDPWPVVRNDASRTVHGPRVTGHNLFDSQGFDSAHPALSEVEGQALAEEILQAAPLIDKGPKIRVVRSGSARSSFRFEVPRRRLREDQIRLRQTIKARLTE